MDCKLGLWMGLLVSLPGCFDGEPVESHGCPTQDVVELAPEDDPQSYARAESAQARGTLTIDGEALELELAVQSVLGVAFFEEEPCANFWGGYQAEAVLSADDGASLSIPLPGTVHWSDGEPRLRVRSGEPVAVDPSVQLPYTPPASWLVVGLEVRGGCGSPQTLHAVIARDACEDPQQCEHTTTAAIGALEVEGHTGCRF